ncbi:MAG: hypothetical protein AAF741_19485, partial [Bacteroidota bacterium]
MKQVLPVLRPILLFGALLLSSFSILLNAQSDYEQLQKLVAGNRTSAGLFGDAVAIDGDLAVVGAGGEDNDPDVFNFGTGAAYIFERDADGNWILLQRLISSDRAANDQFGFSVAIDGSTVIVGARLQDLDSDGNNSRNDAGAAYVFERDSDGDWNQVQKLTSSDRSSNDNFGFSVSLSGGVAFISSCGSGFGINNGSVYVFERDGNDSWSEVQKLSATDISFGCSLAVDGNAAVIGSFREDEDASGGNPLDNAGAAFFYERDADGTWNEIQKVVPSDRAASDQFGSSVSISGNLSIIGAPDKNDFTGVAYIFERDVDWSEVQKLESDDQTAGDELGRSVSIDGNQAVVGARLQDTDTDGGAFVFNTGAAYIFEHDAAGNWGQVQKLVASGRGQFDLFGFAVSISNGTILVGSRNGADENDSGLISNAGSAYIFGIPIPPCEEVTFANLPATPLTVECDDIPAVAVVTATIEQDEIIDPFVFVSEFHYDNGGGDVGEFIEVTGTAGFNLDGYSLELYNGNGGASYNTFDLSGNIIDNEGNGYGAVSIATPSIQNGSPDGFALVDDAGVVVQFLSYEGSFTATDGPAEGLTSTDVGVVETGGTAIGESLQLTGTGCTDADFSWNPPA